MLAKVYRVSRANVTPSRELRAGMHTRLSQWSLDLPEHLDYKVQSSRPCPAPHVLAMHIQYWATVLLLHRPLYVVWFYIYARCWLTYSLVASRRAPSMQSCVPSINYVYRSSCSC